MCIVGGVMDGRSLPDGCVYMYDGQDFKHKGSVLKSKERGLKQQKRRGFRSISINQVLKIGFYASLLLLITGCHGNSVPYRHVSLNKHGILVDKIVTLETGKADVNDNDKSVDKIVKIGIENVPTSGSIDDQYEIDTNDRYDDTGSNDRYDDEREANEGTELDFEFGNTNDVEEVAKEENDLQLLRIIEELRSELREVKIAQDNDRQHVLDLQSQMTTHREEVLVGLAEAIQVRQLVSENYDTITRQERLIQDNSFVLEGLQQFQKEARKELRKFHEYKDRAGKRFHQLENRSERNEKSVEAFTSELRQVFQQIDNFTELLETVGQSGAKLREFVVETHKEFNQILNNLTSHCLQLSHQVANHLDSFEQSANQNPVKYSPTSNQNQEYSSTNQNGRKPTNRNPGSQNQYSNIEIVEFGSGDYQNGIKTNENSNFENSDFGSGETIQEGSGEYGSGDSETLPPFIDLSVYVERNEFQRENAKLKEILDMYATKYENLSSQATQIGARLTSIQLGNFMQSLQESMINFTQNVITIDQWKMSSSQIVNSTLYNQDKIDKLTGMVLENSDKMTDMTWKVSNNELLSSQQFNILKMYIIRLNNSMEDMKEDISKLEKKQTKVFQNGNQYSGFYGYQTGYGSHAGNQQSGSEQGSSDGNQQEGGNQGDYKADGQSDDRFAAVMLRLDELGLQLVFNQNRLGNLEVKMLNESLYTCRKYNIDAYQDSQLASHEAIIKSNANSLYLTHTFVKELDNSVRELGYEIRSNARKIRSGNQAMSSLRTLVPAMMTLKKEVDHFKYQLPTDCSEYHDRGYRKSGVYIIHPITAQHSHQVTCHMTQDGGWTVIQQRFDGSVDFHRNWTEYSVGFGSVDSEYWLGNYLIHLLTSHSNYSLEIIMGDNFNETWSANYNSFSLSNPDENYRISVTGYDGNATDGMGYSDNMAFSTIDQDHDASSMNCAFFYEAGWWYKHCQTCNLNGRYSIGFQWFNLNTNDYIRLQSSVMRIRRTS